jgi:4-hydroxybenzoate polyprenyltransferase|tara:strand:+ start:3413 stop:4318 length:906 start_codon:yes stop_codon:yes gene_type:complete
MKDKRSFIKRFIEFQNERLQLGVLIFTTAAVVLSSVAVSLPVGDIVSNYYAEILISIFTLLVFMFHIRVLDEHKDFEFDSEHHKDRPVQRGLISLRELFVVDVLCLIVILLINLFFPARAIFFLLLALGYTLLAGKEFFIKSWIRERFFLYNLLNLLQLLFLQFYLYALINPNFSFGNPLLSIHFIFVLFNVGIIEFARKLKSKSEETSANDTYSSRLGIKKAVLIYILICLIVYGLFFYMMVNLVFSQFIFVLSLVFLNLVILSTLSYVSKNSKSSALILQSFAALFYIAMHLLLVFTKL